MDDMEVHQANKHSVPSVDGKPNPEGKSSNIQ